jgi:hypothetical protein
MNGAQGATMDFAESVAAAENLANVVYNLSERCLMAHTLRAVEWHVCEEYNKNVFPIILTVSGLKVARVGKVMV